MIKKLNLLDSTMLVMGSMIGSGIFIVSAGMSRDLMSVENLLFAWIITGVLTLFGALSYAELGAAMPKAGGQYIYLKEAYGKLFGFLYGWTLFTVIQTGTIAAVAVAFAKFSGVLFPFISEKNVLLQIGGFSLSSVQVLGIVVVWLLTFSNFREVKQGAFIQNVFTISKIAALVFVIGAGFYFVLGSDQTHWTLNLDNFTPAKIGLGVFSAALVGSIFSSDAWNNITFTAGEIDKPEKNLPRALMLGTGGVTLLYLFSNLVYVKALSLEQIQTAEFDRVGTLLMNTVFGSTGAILMAIMIMVSTFGCINGLTLSGARVYYAMAKDGYFLKQAATLNEKGSPQKALIMQGVWTSILTLSGSYSELLDYVVFAVLLFYILTVSAVFVLRKKQPGLNRPYKVLAYPIIPAIYIIMASVICVSLLIYKPDYSYPGLAIVLLGVPVYYYIKSREK
ncbi:MAG: amino acid permease [Bacteroidia bacterium]|nr:amino acid permease [Bacteroidia bacterium]MCF8426968.1 amino acid permease [Bacteroidia bacterium]